MRLMPVTERQQMFLDIISDACEQGRPPTLREIGAALGISSPNGVHCQLRSLIQKKAIVAFGHGSRCYRLAAPRPPEVSVLEGGEVLLRFPGRMLAMLTPEEAMQLEEALAAARTRKSA